LRAERLGGRIFDEIFTPHNTGTRMKFDKHAPAGGKTRGD